MSSSLMFLELFLFHGIVLAWAFYEYRKTSKLLERTREEERLKSAALENESSKG